MHPRCLTIALFAFVLAACAEQDQTVLPVDAPSAEEQSWPAASTANDEAAFELWVGSLIEDMLERSPEWAIYRGRYDHAGELTVADAAHRSEQAAFIERMRLELEAFDRQSLPVELRTDYDLLDNRLASMDLYLNTLRTWSWQPSNYNVAGPVSILLNTDFAPLVERLSLIRDRLEDVPAYYAAAQDSLEIPTAEHTELAIGQNRGAKSVLAQVRERAAEADLDEDLAASIERAVSGAEQAIDDWIVWLEARQAEIGDGAPVRTFRLGEELYEQKFALDIQADFTAYELYQRALDEKEQLLEQMNEHAATLWPKYFPDTAAPDDRLERIARIIDRLSQDHARVEDFVPIIRAQMPELEAFVREHDLLDQDPDKPLVVRETPEYMRGTGAIASVSAPGPFNPQAETYYNVTPLESYGEELAASYLREYNDWMLQILNIHEGIPGHYTQLLHANKSPSLVKSLFGNGAMIEGWAVYSEGMMLEAGWGDHAPELLLMHGKWLLRVVHNTILDYSVHVLGMEADEAIRMMREEAFQELSEATQKWRRLTLSQVQLTSYYAGYAAIMDLREQQRERLGEDFDLKAFHNEFLSFGSAPVNTIAELMNAER